MPGINIYTYSYSPRNGGLDFKAFSTEAKLVGFVKEQLRYLIDNEKQNIAYNKMEIPSELKDLEHEVISLKNSSSLDDICNLIKNYENYVKLTTGFYSAIHKAQILSPIESQ